MINITPLFKLYSQFRSRRLKQLNVSNVQKHQLLKLLKKAASTRFGIQYDFQQITSVEEYQRTVPLRTYDDFWHEFWEPEFPKLVDCTWPGKIPYFAVTTGTTATGKRIPLTQEMIHSNAKASLDLFCHDLANHPRSRILGGKGYLYGGLTEIFELRHNVYAGGLHDLLIYKTMPWWGKPWYFSPIAKIALIENMDRKMHTLARELVQQDLHSLSGFPPLLLGLFQQFQEVRRYREDFRLADYFPHLDMLVHGGVSMTPYMTQFSKFLEGSQCDLRELYATSEGFIAIADRQPGEGLRLNCDHGIFYEFIPFEEFHRENPTRCWIDTVQTGVDYAIVLSTCAGLWSYILGDVIQFVDLNPPRILITGRTANTLSVFGEKVLEEQMAQAVTTAADTIGAIVSEFTVGASYPQNPGDWGKYRYILEFQDTPPEQHDLDRFTETIDRTLRQQNGVYDAVQQGSGGFDAPDLLLAAPGTFRAWLASKGNLHGKVPRIMADTQQFESLVQFTQKGNEVIAFQV